MGVKSHPVYEHQCSFTHNLYYKKNTCMIIIGFSLFGNTYTSNISIILNTIFTIIIYWYSARGAVSYFLCIAYTYLHAEYYIYILYK